jgi:hypothetical protein
MKKTLVIIGAVLAAAVINLSAQLTNVTISVPANLPAGYVQNIVKQSTVQLAYQQIQFASLAQLSALTPSIGINASNNLAKISAAGLTNMPDGFANYGVLFSARQEAISYLRSQPSLDAVNSNVVAVLPLPPQLTRPATNSFSH